MAKTAKYIRSMSDWRGDARVYELSCPLESHDFVIVSAVVVPITGAETYIFGCDRDGENVDYCELDGSFRGALDHAEALRRAGYDLAAAA